MAAPAKLSGMKRAKLSGVKSLPTRPRSCLVEKVAAALDTSTTFPSRGRSHAAITPRWSSRVTGQACRDSELWVELLDELVVAGKTSAVSLFTIRYSVSAISIIENPPLTVEYQISIVKRRRQSALKCRELIR
jgi:hypothetical protein